MISRINHIRCKMDLETTKLGERGQIVIPQEFRQQLNFKKGEKLIMVLENDKIIVEAMRNLDSNTFEELKEELLDIKIVDKFWEEVKNGSIIKQSKDEFLAELEQW